MRKCRELKLWHRVSQEILKVHLTFACFPSSNRYWDQTWERFGRRARADNKSETSLYWIHCTPAASVSFPALFSTDTSGLPAFPLSDTGKGTKATD